MVFTDYIVHYSTDSYYKLEHLMKNKGTVCKKLKVDNLRPSQFKNWLFIKKQKCIQRYLYHKEQGLISSA